MSLRNFFLVAKLIRALGAERLLVAKHGGVFGGGGLAGFKGLDHPAEFLVLQAEGVDFSGVLGLGLGKSQRLFEVFIFRF
jgi:hypothetical protein